MADALPSGAREQEPVEALVRKLRELVFAFAGDPHEPFDTRAVQDTFKCLQASADYLTQMLAALQQARQRAQDAEQERDRLVDLPLCRLQFPDGTVPGNTEEALAGWHRVAKDARTEVQQARKDLEIATRGLAADHIALRELLAQRAHAEQQAAELQASLDRLYGMTFSDRVYHALKSRAERAEARLTALEGLPHYAFDQTGAIYGPVDPDAGTFVRFEDLASVRAARTKEI
jgi:uncharacterized protein YdiU (UPF0061 family)